ncbi:MAG: hypothetical protein AB7I41_12000 [Candidatus Sericytochromatia bacterium]
MPSEILKDIYSVLLTRYQREAQWFEAGPEQTALLLPLGDGPEPVQLQLFSADAPVRLPQEDHAPSTGILYFFAEFALPGENFGTADLAKLLSYLNYVLPLGSLELSPARSIYYRYGLLTESPWVESRSATDIVLLLDQLLPRFKTWLEKVLTGIPPISPDLYQVLRHDFQDLLNHRIRSRVAHPPARNMPRERLSELRHGLGYFGVGFTAVLASTLLTPWLGSSLGLGLGLMTLVPGFAWVYRSQMNHRQRQRIQKKQAKFDFYFQILESEQTRVSSHIQQIQNYRDQNDYTLMHMRQSAPESPSQLVRLHTQSKQIVAFQERLLQRSTDLKKRKADLELSTEHLKLEHQLFVSGLDQKKNKVMASISPETLPSAAEPLWPLLLRLASMLNYLDFTTTPCPHPEDPAKGVLLVDLPQRPQALQISAIADWLPPDAQRESAQESQQSMMLCFQVGLDLALPPEKLNETAELLVHFNRFLPIGAIQLMPQTREIVFRHHFVRLQGDISNFLIIEILEILSFFSQKIGEKLHDFFHSDKTMSEILSDTETEFLSLMN